MSKAIVLNDKFEKASESALPAEFDKINPHNLYLYVKSYMAALRANTAHTKNRSEVSGGGKKPWRQKGTGHARQGSIRAPQWTHGGVALGPKPRDYGYTLNKKVRRLAMKSALSSKVLEKEIIVLDELKFDAPKTKEMIKVLENIKAGRKALIITAEKDENVVRSAANIPGVRTALVTTMNVYDIINHTNFIVTKEAVKKIEEVYS